MYTTEMVMSYVAGAFVISQVLPDVCSWSWWGVKTICCSTYWLVYGRFEQQRREKRIAEIVKAQLTDFELVVGGTDLILVPKKNK